MMNLVKTLKKRLSFKKPLDSILYIFALLIVFYYFNKYVLTNMSVENFDGKNFENDGKKKLVYFYMNGCPHCDSFSPVWDEFKKTSPLPTYKIESTDSGKMMSKYKISGFPTILLLDENNKKLKELEGDRTVANLNAMISDHN
jgi:thiol-disulfide isomerase/thioredoxin